MESIRKWFYRPKKDDTSLLAQFFFADEALNLIASELDSFDGRKDPERCTSLVNQLRQSQDKVLTITNSIMDVLIGNERANRDFRVKFPEDVLQENLAGQLWFGAECLAAGSSIMNREAESAAMRPLAKALTKSLENVRNLLREACLRNNTPNGPLKLNNDELVTEMLLESLKIFDRLFAEFELCYVSAMVPVKTTQEYELQEFIGVLFSETLQRALQMKLLTQEMVDDCDPALMFTIPRLAIVSGLLVFPDGPLCVDRSVDEMSEMFRPFRRLLLKIREFLRTLNKRELYMLEKLLCDNEQMNGGEMRIDMTSINDEFLAKFYAPNVHFNHHFNAAAAAAAATTTTTAATTATASMHQATNECDVEAVIQALEEKIELDEQKPSTSNGYLIPNTVEHDSIVAAMSTIKPDLMRAESLPDHDSLLVISDAAATLTSILNTKDNCNNNTINSNNNNNSKLMESPDDSGICTENTSLDRSPSMEIGCQCHCATINKQQQHQQHSPSTSKCQTMKKCCATKQFKNNLVQQQQQQQQHSNDDTSSVGSTDTSSSFSSECTDDEIALAKFANRNEVRGKFRSINDLIHRLYVCIAGVADQLQTNFASDLRNILKSVFLMNASNDSETSSSSTTTMGNNVMNSDAASSTTSSMIEYHPSNSDVVIENEFSVDPNILAQEALFDSNVYFHLNGEHDMESSSHLVATSIVEGQHRNVDDGDDGDEEEDDDADADDDDHHHDHHAVAVSVQERPPIWIPDIEAPKCMSCGANFTVVKRRHHCRNCGKVFCARCSSNSVPLPKFGHTKAVRVCNKCFMYHLAPFTM